MQRIAETIREIGILVLVFGILDEYNRTCAPARLSLPWLATVLLVSVGLIVAGITLEWLVTLTTMTGAHLLILSIGAIGLLTFAATLPFALRARKARSDPAASPGPSRS